MNIMTTEKAAALKNKNRSGLKRRIINCMPLYALLIPAIVLTIMFKYAPMYGIQLAFKDLIPGRSITESPWVGLKHFLRFFSMPNFWHLIWNTFKVAIVTNLVSFPLPIIFALMVNQVRHTKYKKIVQNVSYIPHLLSIVIVISITSLMLAPGTGVVNILLKKFGKEDILFFGHDEYVLPIYVLTGIWQNMGFDAIIYIAALSSVDQDQIEAAKIDGASRLKTIWHIELPSITNTIIIMLILSWGQIFALGADKMLLLQTPLNLGGSEIISTYVYKVGLLEGQFGFSTAVDLFNTMVNLTCLLIVNAIAKKYSDNSIF